ncbi:1-phosphatidylinositol phosphodiesterase [Ceratocystis lukuohia]|uniref:1-phosphatidylinositol phosphodiesterase n=1 Tax=Ceratocystis lukuohia TaxID=2019550 RepID=A0ABR4MA73_9PEZI
MHFSLFATLGCLAFSHAGFDNGISEIWSFDLGLFQNTDWMSILDDDVRLSSLAIPGTHNSMTDKIENIMVQTQNHPLERQLYGGIRYIDISCRLEDVLTTLFDFLDNHPREAIILRIQKGGVLDNHASFLNSIERHFAPGSELGDRAVQHIYSTNIGDNYIPALGEVRGKVLILQDFKTIPASRYGIRWDSRSISYYSHKLSINRHFRYLKWAGIKSHLSRSRSEDNDKLRITYTTAGAGLKPIYIAAKNGITDAINRLLGHYLVFKKGSCFGVVVMDFPGYEVVELIVQLNDRYRAFGRPDFPSGHSSINMANDFDHDEAEPIDDMGLPFEASDDEAEIIDDMGPLYESDDEIDIIDDMPPPPEANDDEASGNEDSLAR